MFVAASMSEYLLWNSLGIHRGQSSATRLKDATFVDARVKFDDRLTAIAMHPRLRPRAE
jgi:hypothetical protein